MGKKKQQNEFFFFMMEKKGEVERRMGRTVTMGELPNLLFAEWKAIPESEKQRYRNMKESRRGEAAKLDCRGIPLADIQQEQEKKKKKIEEMKSYLMNNIAVLQSSNALQCGTFYVVSSSYYVQTEEGYYVPAELGLVKFSFQKGIIKEFHIILKPVIPMSYGFSANTHSEATHKLLEEENNGAENKEEVAEMIMEFVEEESSRLPPLYTLEEQMEQTEAILGDICGTDHFTVYSLDQLFQNLYSVTFPDHPIPLCIATDMLTNCSIDFHPSLPCDWHQAYQKDAGRYCSLACSRRWVFHMCDNMKLLEKFGIQPQEGKHKPLPMPSFGVVVDVPKQIFKDPAVGSNVNRTKSDSNYPATAWGKPSATGETGNGEQNGSWNSRPQVDTGFSFTRKPKPSSARGTDNGEQNCRPQADTGFSFTRKAKVEATSGIQAKSSGGWASVVNGSYQRAASSSLQSISSINTSCEEDFPSLGQPGPAWKSASRGRRKM